MATLVLVFLSIALGIVIGSNWPGVDSARIVAHPSFQSFVRPYLFLLIPNMLWLSGCFFVLAALTRQMAPVYVAGVILLVGYMTPINLLGDMDNKTLAAMIDPSGATAFDVLARYWSVAQKNAQEIPLEGELLWNRMLWLGVGLVVTLAGYAAFRMQTVAPSRGRKRKAVDEPRARACWGAGGAADACGRPARGRLRAHAPRACAAVSRARSCAARAS